MLSIARTPAGSRWAAGKTILLVVRLAERWEDGKMEGTRRPLPPLPSTAESDLAGGGGGIGSPFHQKCQTHRLRNSDGPAHRHWQPTCASSTQRGTTSPQTKLDRGRLSGDQTMRCTFKTLSDDVGFQRRQLAGEQERAGGRQRRENQRGNDADDETATAKVTPTRRNPPPTAGSERQKKRGVPGAER